MQVTEVDAGLLQYQSLEELTLTGNLLKTVRGEHLPPQLKVGSHTHVAHMGGKVVCSSALHRECTVGADICHLNVLSTASHTQLAQHYIQYAL